MTDSSTESLRFRRCCNPSCNSMFSVCRSCDRGQRYCSHACRRRMRKRQVVAAGRRYQASAAGRQTHCRRQRACRLRPSQASVTHQGPVSITTSSPTSPPRLTQCAFCGNTNRWIDPFCWLGIKRPRTRRRRPATDVQNSTLSRDR
jgi:hypothetical protein